MRSLRGIFGTPRRDDPSRVASSRREHRNPNIEAASSKHFEIFGPEIKRRREEHLRDAQNRYQNIYPQGFIKRCLDILAALREKHQAQDAFSAGADAEAIFIKTSDLFKWLGPDAQVLPTSEYDDRRGIGDFMIELANSSDQKNTLLIGVDITSSQDEKTFEEKSTPLAHGKIEPDRKELFSLGGVLRKFTFYISRSFPGYSINAQEEKQGGLWAPTIALSIPTKQIDAYLEQVYDKNTKTLHESATIQTGMETHPLRITILEGLIKGCNYQISFLKDNKDKLSSEAGYDEKQYTQTLAILKKTLLYFEQLLQTVKAEQEKRATQASQEAALATEVPPTPTKQPIPSLDQLKRQAAQAQQDLERIQAFRDKVQALHAEIKKTEERVKGARRHKAKLEAVQTPYQDDQLYDLPFLVRHNIIPRPPDYQGTPEEYAAEYQAILDDLGNSLTTLETLEAPTSDEQETITTYKTLLGEFRSTITNALEEKKTHWEGRRAKFLERIAETSTQHLQETRGIFTNLLADGSIREQLQRNHPDVWRKIKELIPDIGFEEPQGSYLEEAGRIRSHIDTYLRLQSETIGIIEDIGDPEIFQDAIEQFSAGDTKPLYAFMAEDVLNVLITDEHGPKAKGLMHALQIITREDYQNFHRDAVHSFLCSSEQGGGMHIQPVKDASTLIAKAKQFQRNHEVLIFIAKDVLGAAMITPQGQEPEESSGPFK